MTAKPYKVNEFYPALEPSVDVFSRKLASLELAKSIGNTDETGLLLCMQDVNTHVG